MSKACRFDDDTCLYLVQDAIALKSVFSLPSRRIAGFKGSLMRGSLMRWEALRGRTTLGTAFKLLDDSQIEAPVLAAALLWRLLQAR